MDSPLKSGACQPGWPLFSPAALVGRQQAASEAATRQEREEEEGGPAREGGPEPSQLGPLQVLPLTPSWCHARDSLCPYPSPLTCAPQVKQILEEEAELRNWESEAQAPSTDSLHIIQGNPYPGLSYVPRSHSSYL